MTTSSDPRGSFAGVLWPYEPNPSHKLNVYIVTAKRLVYNISSPFRHNRKPLIFQWVLTLGNAGIGSVSIPAFCSVNAH